MTLHELILKYHPEYSDIRTYPADKVAGITKTTAPWGILGNFAKAPITIDGVTFPTSEHLFHIMKFRDTAARKDIKSLAGMPMKWAAKKYEGQGIRREDWGEYIVDAMKFCLVTKYAQCEAFRSELEKTRGLYILEDETNRMKRKHKGADSWGAILSDDGQTYVGPNLLGRLLMELRDNGGALEYNIPEDMTDFKDLI